MGLKIREIDLPERLPFIAFITDRLM